jgi:serine/threonine protein kinase
VETSAHERLANFTYSAPEQRTRGQVVGPPADIWAVGLIVNELFTRQIPLGRDHPRISSIAAEYAHLDQIADQMLRQSPEARPDVAMLKSHFQWRIPARSRLTLPANNTPKRGDPHLVVGVLRYHLPDFRLVISS